MIRWLLFTSCILRTWTTEYNNLQNETQKPTYPHEASPINSHSKNVSLMLNHVLLDYDKRLRPFFGETFLIVNVSMDIHNFGPIDEVDKKFRIDMAFRQYWIDPRLEYNEELGELILNEAFISQIWQPDTYFRDSYEATKHKVMNPNVLLHLYPNGTVFMSSRITVYSKCNMDLTYFPRDKQQCPLIVETYGYPTKDLRLNWAETSDMKKWENKIVGQFHISTVMSVVDQTSLKTGTFSLLKVMFTLERSLQLFIVQTYLPATLIVILSWVSFFVNRAAVPARASLAVTTVLTMMTLMAGTNSSLPKVSVIKALDVYFGICFVYVVCALVEFAIVCYLNKPRFKPEDNELKAVRIVKIRAKPPPSTSEEKPKMSRRASIKNSMSLRYKKFKKISKRHSERGVEIQKQIKVDVSKIDLYSRIIFPVTFFVCVITYYNAYSNDQVNMFDMDALNKLDKLNNFNSMMKNIENQARLT